MRVRNVLPVLFFVLLVGLGTSFGFLLDTYFDHQKLQVRYETLEHDRLEQRLDILFQARKLSGLQLDYDRIDDFCRKLMVMTNMSGPRPDWDDFTGSGGPLINSMTLSPYDTRTLVRNMQGAVVALNRDVLDSEVLQQLILKQVRENKQLLDSTPSVWPVKGRITSGFGMRQHPFDKTYKFHRGLDIVPPGGRGTPIHAPANGVVVFAGRDGGYGLSLLIRHKNNITTRYGHLKAMAVKRGQKVRRDDVIAYVGNTGRSTGPHLHYEVLLAGKPQNPRRYILN
ncbi:Peptidase family M23 [Paucidesulfovibrio gracilis DSM 16080]|uniref:Peptidase family M23 n=1 Tax=Paucidesulfovibrio gracilis DSM 16080 TaxID=1121449 RepID=A0A1T4W5B0_9BACT|nr:M23 family metallopeptidase [Paucidesulfovibrio gracilis]SKA72225.1 Peptidase family M23 [Paucidesulfovibrio gracilis DSM 16080]